MKSNQMKKVYSSSQRNEFGYNTVDRGGPRRHGSRPAAPAKAKCNQGNTKRVNRAEEWGVYRKLVWITKTQNNIRGHSGFPTEPMSASLAGLEGAKKKRARDGFLRLKQEIISASHSGLHQSRGRGSKVTRKKGKA